MKSYSFLSLVLLAFFLLAACAPATIPGSQKVEPPAITPSSPPTTTSAHTSTPPPLPTYTMSPTPFSTSTPIPTPIFNLITTEIVATMTAAEKPTVIRDNLSPDGHWLMKVIRYECLPIASWEAEPPNYAYEELRLVDVKTGSETIVDTQLQYCYGPGAFGLGIEFWSSDSRYVYYTGAFIGRPDGGGYWEPSLTCLDTLTGEKISLRMGEISPNRKMLTMSSDKQVTVWSIDQGEILRLPYALPEKIYCGTVWSADSRSLVYWLGEPDCGAVASQLSLVRVDLENGNQELFAETGTELISRIGWEAPHHLTLDGNCRKTWTIDPYQYTSTKPWTPPGSSASLYPLPPTVGVLQSSLKCSSGKPYNHCSDDLLGVDFDVPAAWGEITTELRTGQYCGYAYNYSFPDRGSQPDPGIWAGGRSWDFSEGRGYWFTDFNGWGNSTVEKVCAEIGFGYCRVIQPEVVFAVYFPTAEELCTSSPHLGSDVQGAVQVNLPKNNAVNGFTFVSRLLSEKDQQALEVIFGYSEQYPFRQCNSETTLQYETKRSALLQYLQEGSGMPFDQETLMNIKQILHIAKSIKIR